LQELKALLLKSGGPAIRRPDGSIDPAELLKAAVEIDVATGLNKWMSVGKLNMELFPYLFAIANLRAAVCQVGVSESAVAAAAIAASKKGHAHPQSAKRARDSAIRGAPAAYIPDALNRSLQEAYAAASSPASSAPLLGRRLSSTPPATPSPEPAAPRRMPPPHPKDTNCCTSFPRTATTGNIID